MSLFDTLKYYGRGIVLPVKDIKKYIKSVLIENGITDVIDFGSGTLFWSEYFAEELSLEVLAVDNQYTVSLPMVNNPRISFHTDIVEVIKSYELRNATGKRGIFICDVIHHLPPGLWDVVLPEIVKLFDVIIVKDIDANRKFGNLCNRMHDRIINDANQESKRGSQH